MFDGDEMFGFLCCYKPWDNAFNSMVKDTFTPIHAHGAITDVAKIREMRMSLSAHLGESPCFIRFIPAFIEKWLERVESHDSRIFVAMQPTSLLPLSK